MKFDVTVANPPYQISDDGHGASATPIYDQFIEFAFRHSDKTVYVTPSRWMAGGKGLDDFREWMLNRNDIVSITHYDNENSPFHGSADLPGGVSWFYRNSEYSGNVEVNGKRVDTSKYDILIKDPDVYPLLDKILESSDHFLSEIYVSNSYYGIRTNDDRLKNERETKHDVKCYVSQEKGFEKWINPVYLGNVSKFWKIVTSESYGEYPRFGNMFVAKPEEVFTQSYIGFYLRNEEQAYNLKSYLQTDFANFFLSLRKNTQHISQKTVKWIPLPNMNEEWNDEKLFEHYSLTDEEIEIIR